MKTGSPQQLTAWLGWALARLGRPGQAGLVLLGLAILTCLLLVKPLEDEAQGLRQQADRLARTPPPPPPEAAEQAWLARLPASHAGHAYLARLFAAAESAGISLEEGRYREARDQESGLDRLAIVLPVSGSYLSLRAFLAQALAKEPSLALEGMRLFRESIEEGEVQGELRFLLILGAKS